jgi:hypothetical protein
MIIGKWAELCTTLDQECQMVYFRTKIHNLGIFRRAFKKYLNVGIFNGHLEYFYGHLV